MIIVILLAAGQSKRIPGENKLIKYYKNKPLINHSIDAIKKSKVNKIIIVLGYQSNQIKRLIKKNKKINFVINKNYKKGMSSSIKCGLRKITSSCKGFIIAQSDMPFVKTSDINKIYKSIKEDKNLVYALSFKNRVGNPIGFDISIIKKFKNIKGKFGAKFMVKRLKKETKFIKVSSKRRFKDFDLKKDFN